MERKRIKDFSITGHPIECAALIVKAIESKSRKAKKNEDSHHTIVKITDSEIHIDIKERSIDGTKTLFFAIPIEEGESKARKLLRTLKEIAQKKKKFVPPIIKSSGQAYQL